MHRFGAAGKHDDIFLTLESRPLHALPANLLQFNSHQEMMMKNTKKGLLVALALQVAANAFAQAANPAAMAREGSYEQTLCFGGPAHLINASDTDRYGTYQVTGGTQSANKAFDAMSLECIGTFEMRSGAYRHKGYCVFQDPNGDKFHATDIATPQSYAVEILGGTGKFKGITGSGTIERLGAMTPVRQGTLQGCRRVTGSYKLP